MYTRMSVLAALFLVIAISVSVPLAAEQPLRGLVVDRGDDVLWLGFPSAAQKGMVFNVSLLAGGEAIARAEVVEATPDAPYVAKATFRMLDKKAFIPIGAYVETRRVEVADVDQSPGYKAVNFGEKDANRLSLSIGALFPSDDQLQDETDDAWPAFQLDYRLSRSETTDLSIGVGFYRRHGTFVEGVDAGKRDLQVIPVTLDLKFGAERSPKQGGWYGKVGAGAFIVRDERTVGAVSDSVRNTRIGWQAAIGHESKTGRTVQLGYIDARQSDFKGVTLTLGARF